jgi:hypothetical protein
LSLNSASVWGNIFIKLALASLALLKQSSGNASNCFIDCQVFLGGCFSLISEDRFSGILEVFIGTFPQEKTKQLTNAERKLYRDIFFDAKYIYTINLSYFYDCLQ